MKKEAKKKVDNLIKVVYVNKGVQAAVAFPQEDGVFFCNISKPGVKV